MPYGGGQVRKNKATCIVRHVLSNIWEMSRSRRVSWNGALLTEATPNPITAA